MNRVGIGYDAHRFEAGDHIVLGGVTIPFDQGIKAHSDGDVVLHALADALLGACALGDIGQHFPDTGAEHANADSMQFIIKVMDLIAKQGFQVINADMVIIAQAPKMAPHINAMRHTIATLLSVEKNAISVKATTNEGMGFIGRGEGIAVQAIVSVMRFLDSI